MRADSLHSLAKHIEGGESVDVRVRPTGRQTNNRGAQNFFRNILFNRSVSMGETKRKL